MEASDGFHRPASPLDHVAVIRDPRQQRTAGNFGGIDNQRHTTQHRALRCNTEVHSVVRLQTTMVPA